MSADVIVAMGPVDEFWAVTTCPWGISASGWRKTFSDLAEGMSAVLVGGRAEHVANPAVYAGMQEGVSR